MFFDRHVVPSFIVRCSLDYQQVNFSCQSQYMFILLRERNTVFFLLLTMRALTQRENQCWAPQAYQYLSNYPQAFSLLDASNIRICLCPSSGGWNGKCIAWGACSWNFISAPHSKISKAFIIIIIMCAVSTGKQVHIFSSFLNSYYQCSPKLSLLC